MSKEKKGQAERYEERYFVDSTRPVWNYSLFTDEDIRNYQQGTHYHLYDLFGAHEVTVSRSEEHTSELQSH